MARGLHGRRSRHRRLPRPRRAGAARPRAAGRGRGRRRKHHAAALASGAAAPGQPLGLRRDAANEHDPNAIAVDTPDGEQLGWVPRELAAELAPRLDAGEPWSVIALRESRPSPRDPRTGITMLLAAAPEIVLRPRPR